MNTTALMLLACLALAGCWDQPAVPQKRGEARAAMFRECMALAANLPRQADDDVADIVQACSTQAWYMTNHVQ